MKATIYINDSAGKVLGTTKTVIASDHNEATLLQALAPSVGGAFENDKVYHVHLSTDSDRLILTYVVERGLIVYPPKRK